MKTKQNVISALLIVILAFTLGACSSATDGSGETSNSMGTEQNTTVPTDTQEGTGEINSTTSAESNETASEEQNTTTSTGNDTNTTTAETNTSTQTEAPVLQSLKLTVSKTSLNKDENTSVKAEATYTDNSTKDVTAKVQWVVTPSDAVKVSNTTLTALQDKPTTLSATIDGIRSNAVQLDITWVVNGHVLPPEPDKTINDSTLLGIDVNDNGVRDDVERWIYKTYDHPIERGIFMQSARAYQKVIVDPSKAHETMKYIDNSSDCEGYWRYWKVLYKDKNESYVLERYRDLEKEIRPIQFNTLKRHMGYERFNASLSGGVYTSGKISKEQCEFDKNGILKDLP